MRQKWWKVADGEIRSITILFLGKIRGQEIMPPVDEPKNNGKITLCKVTKITIKGLKILILLNREVGVLN